MDKKSIVIRALQSKNCLKVIAGINNFNKEQVLQIVRAADQMQATCVDISAREDIVTEAVAIAQNTAIVVSSIHVAELIRAEELGADMLELGNFEALHDEGIFPSAKLEELGVDMLQTEGASLVEASSPAALGQIEKVRLTLANTIEISKAVSQTFILTASGISPDTAKLAIAAGAHGVGVGKYVNKLESSLEMMAAIKALQEVLNVQSSKNVLETSI